MSPHPNPPLKCPSSTTDGPNPAKPAPTPSGSGAPRVVAEGVRIAVGPDPQQGDGRYPLAWLRISAPKGAVPTVSSWCACGRDLFAAGHRKATRPIADHTAHRDARPPRTTRKGGPPHDQHHPARAVHRRRRAARRGGSLPPPLQRLPDRGRLRRRRLVGRRTPTCSTASTPRPASRSCPRSRDRGSHARWRSWKPSSRTPCTACHASAAALFRSVSDSAEGGPPILFDEIDTIFGPKAGENEDLARLPQRRIPPHRGRPALRRGRIEPERAGLPLVLRRGRRRTRLPARHDPDPLRHHPHASSAPPTRRWSPSGQRIHEKQGHALRDRLANGPTLSARR